VPTKSGQDDRGWALLGKGAATLVACMLVPSRDFRFLDAFRLPLRATASRAGEMTRERRGD
jgi:hypothetical protein